MKITQTDTQIELRSSGLGQLVIGIVTILVGIGVIIVLLGSSSDNGKKAPAWSVLIGIFFIIFGVLMALFAKNRTVTVRKGGDTSVSAKRVLGSNPQQQTVPTANIVAVRLSTYMENNNGSNGGSGGISGGDSSSRRSVLSLVLNNNDLIEVGGSGGGMGGFNINGINVSSLITKAPLSKEANQVATFLGVPLQADDTSSIAGAIKSIGTAFHQESSQPAQSTPFNSDAQPQTPAATPITPPAAPAPPQAPALPATQQVPRPPYTPQQ
jgi:hypothetical protein